MAFNFDHTSNGDTTFKGAHVAFTGDFIFPLPLQSRDYHILMTDNAGFGLDALSDISQALSEKVNTTDLGSAAYLNADDIDLPLLVDNGNGIGVLSESIIPASILNTQHTVQYYGGLEYLPANKGDIATVISTSETYILCGTNKATDWIRLGHNADIVCSVQTQAGDVCINSSHICGCINSMNDTVENFLSYINTGKANNSDLDNLVTSTCLSDSISNCCFITTANIDSSLASNGNYNYLSSSEFNTCIACLTTCNDFENDIANYLTSASIEFKAGSTSYAFIENQGTLFRVNGDGKIDHCLFGDIAFNTSFQTSCETPEVAGAQPGDVAIGIEAQQGKSWILDNTCTWQLLKIPDDKLISVNGNSPDSNGNVYIDITNIPIDKDTDYTSVACKIETIYCKTAEVYGTYQIESSLVSCLSSDYISTNDFSNCLSAKSDSTHSHLICEITNLESCLNAFPTPPFITGGSYSLASDPSVTLNGTMNVVLGQGGSDAGYDYAIFHAAGDSDAQTIEFKTKSSLSNYVGDVVFGQDGLDLVSADVVAYDSLGNHVSYRVEGLFSTSAGATSIIGEAAVTTFAENVGAYSSNAILVPTSNCVQICVDSAYGTFDLALANVSVVHVH